jgi:hypothetical protein
LRLRGSTLFLFQIKNQHSSIVNQPSSSLRPFATFAASRFNPLPLQCSHEEALDITHWFFMRVPTWASAHHRMQRFKT